LFFKLNIISDLTVMEPKYLQCFNQDDEITY
jgi:hypothetical protein